jgi:hypothetical protein
VHVVGWFKDGHSDFAGRCFCACKLLFLILLDDYEVLWRILHIEWRILHGAIARERLQ